MPFLRKLSASFQRWVADPPDLTQLLNDLDIQRNQTEIKENDRPSIYLCQGDAEQLEAVAALVHILGKPPEKCFGLLIDDADCRAAGVEAIHAPRRGTTGIGRVDQRHYELNGPKENFVELIKRLLGRMWEGEQRLRIYSPQQILGQLALFAELSAHPDGSPVPVTHIHPGSKELCRRVVALGQGATQTMVQGSTLTIQVRLKDKEEVSVTAQRSLH